MSGALRWFVPPCVVVGTLLGWQIATRESVRTSTPLVPPSAIGPTPRAATPTVLRQAAIRTDDALAAYFSMRDDIDAKPRLRWIEDRAREKPSDDTLAVLNAATLDPDEEVRESAQRLRDLAMDAATSAIASSTSGR